ncbi:signal transduction histidine kinase [Paucibacter oligotrophus]|uniref:histidine kinase n=1 Tax=Roseateles oligotrophus TaxID=1769250 RepID=A0A840LF86_9BURK|nr:HAMP domain-containing sensor histidine kinase [Roseateles oligotrophus]MBB4843967.1 signal transduction histidine kinase [Roseateles oligotrophus]
MKSLYLRIYLTLVVLLLAFAFGSAWLFQRHIEQERGSVEVTANDRALAMAELLQLALPSAEASREQQAAALEDWGQRLRMAVALMDAKGQRIAATELFRRRESDDSMPMLSQQVALRDGRSLLLLRPRRLPPAVLAQAREGRETRELREAREGGREFGEGRGILAPPRDEVLWRLPFLGPRPNGQALVILLVLLFFGVALGAYPVVRRLTRRLEALKQGVEQFGAGELAHRVDDQGTDEVAALASSFNRAAAQLETLLRSQQTLLANASHELRSPLARLKMAFSMLDEAGPAQRAKLASEIHTNIAELDALVEEVLLASRLDSGLPRDASETVDLMGLAAEEAARVGADFEPAEGLSSLKVSGEDRLLRRALRNLLENARRYGGSEVLLGLACLEGVAELRVSDRGPGVPEAMRERIFEAFFRLPGHAEQAGGVGLGLSLVKQIAQRHGGQVRCEGRQGGGSVFVLSLPALPG